MRVFLILGSVNLFLGVALGAFGAHGLKTRVSAEMLAVWQTGVQYHLIHGLGLVLLGALAPGRVPEAGLRRAGWMLQGGIVLFSGSLYLLVMTGFRRFGLVTPFGGIAFLIGWLTLAWAARRPPG